MTEQREKGFYWAILKGDEPQDDPAVALWDGKHWWFAEVNAGFDYEEVIVLSDRLQPPPRK